MATEKQKTSNRRNAGHSRGPTSPAGKAQSSRNAIMHGVLSQVALLYNEDAGDFHALEQGFLDSFRPADAVEQMLVAQLLLLLRRIVRAENAEVGALNRSLVEVTEQKAIPPIIEPLQIDAEHDVTTAQLAARRETMLAEAMRHDLSAEALISHLNRYRTADLRNFDLLLGRLLEIQAKRQKGQLPKPESQEGA